MYAPSHRALAPATVRAHLPPHDGPRWLTSSARHAHQTRLLQACACFFASAPQGGARAFAIHFPPHAPPLNCSSLLPGLRQLDWGALPGAACPNTHIHFIPRLRTLRRMPSRRLVQYICAAECAYRQAGLEVG